MNALRTVLYGMIRLPSKGNAMVHDLQSLKQRVQILEIRGFEHRAPDLGLQVSLQCWEDRPYE